MTGLGTVLRVLGAEGPAAARDRFLDRVADWRRRRRFARVSESGPGLTAPVVNVLATPPSVRLGGVQIQFLARQRLEAAERGMAVLYPDTAGYRLERQRGRRRDAVRLAGSPPAPPLALEDPALEAALLAAAERAGARAVHVEGLARLPPASLASVAQAGLGLILTLHDFSLFCARPHLIELPAERFCGYCRDLARCQACLGRDGPVPADAQRRYREAGARVLAAARAVVYPSAFLRDRFAELVPGLDPAIQHVIEPGAVAARAPRDGMAARAGAAARPARHVALVGAVRAQKGAAVFERVVQHLSAGPGGGAPLCFSVLGGGDVPLLHRLRRLPGVRVRGYYRAGSLPRLLRARRVDLALLLSTSPESYGLTLDECLAAGVPVVAFDHGAVAERVRRLGGGVLVPLEAGWRGIADAVATARDGAGPVVDPRVGLRLPRVEDAARAHLALYRELGLG